MSILVINCGAKGWGGINQGGLQCLKATLKKTIVELMNTSYNIEKFKKPMQDFPLLQLINVFAYLELIPKYSFVLQIPMQFTPVFWVQFVKQF